jgi:hypothetical protein
MKSNHDSMSRYGHPSAPGKRYVVCLTPSDSHNGATITSSVAVAGQLVAFLVSQLPQMVNHMQW